MLIKVVSLIRDKLLPNPSQSSGHSQRIQRIHLLFLGFHYFWHCGHRHHRCQRHRLALEECRTKRPTQERISEEKYKKIKSFPNNKQTWNDQSKETALFPGKTSTSWSGTVFCSRSFGKSSATAELIWGRLRWLRSNGERLTDPFRFGFKNGVGVGDPFTSELFLFLFWIGRDHFFGIQWSKPPKRGALFRTERDTLWAPVLQCFWKPRFFNFLLSWWQRIRTYEVISARKNPHIFLYSKSLILLSSKRIIKGGGGEKKKKKN